MINRIGEIQAREDGGVESASIMFTSMEVNDLLRALGSPRPWTALPADYIEKVLVEAKWIGPNEKYVGFDVDTEALIFRQNLGLEIVSRPRSSMWPNRQYQFRFFNYIVGFSLWWNPRRDKRGKNPYSEIADELRKEM